MQIPSICVIFNNFNANTQTFFASVNFLPKIRQFYVIFHGLLNAHCNEVLRKFQEFLCKLGEVPGNLKKEI